VSQKTARLLVFATLVAVLPCRPAHAFQAAVEILTSIAFSPNKSIQSFKYPLPLSLGIDVNFTGVDGWGAWLYGGLPGAAWKRNTDPIFVYSAGMRYKLSYNAKGPRLFVTTGFGAGLGMVAGGFNNELTLHLFVEAGIQSKISDSLGVSLALRDAPILLITGDSPPFFNAIQLVLAFRCWDL